MTANTPHPKNGGIDRKAEGRRQLSTPGTGVRGLARWLELRSYSLTPEYFTLREGLRATLAVAAPLFLVVASGRLDLGWSVFSAFWTCLCDSPGPDRRRRGLLAAFVLFGSVNAFLGSWLASLDPVAGMAAGPALVFLSIFFLFRIHRTALLGTLLAVVAVVAVGFPHPLHGALVQALAFFAGSLWTWLLINVFWRMDQWIPLEQASTAVLARLSDMAANLVATGTGAHPDAKWHAAHGEHRRAVRTAMERLRGLLSRYEGESDRRLAACHTLIDAGETTFSALIALDHMFITQRADAEERLKAAKVVSRALSAWSKHPDDGQPRDAALRRQIIRLRNTQTQVSDDALRGCLIGVEQALSGVLSGTAAASFLAPDAPAPVGWVAAARQGLRQCIGVMVVYYVAHLFDLGYPYWATMAVVVVMQGAVRITWTRSIERIFGSLLGGAAALALLHVTSSSVILPVIGVALAGITIALRSVNYTVFVIFLTMLFVLVTELLQPGVGIASARILDNTLGSVAALLSMFVLWPGFGPSLKVRLQKGLDANRGYRDAVVARQNPIAIGQARRAAGLASIEAELAVHGLGGIRRFRRGLSSEDAAALMELRRLAGEAATGWHRHRAERERQQSSGDQVS